MLELSRSTPKNGYIILTRFEKPMKLMNTADRQINLLSLLYVFFSCAILFKKPKLADICVVTIAPIIIIPYTYL